MTREKTMDLTSNEAFSEFIKDLDVDAYDADFAMFRWNTVTDSRILSEKIGGVGRITGLTVTKRGPGGIAQGLKVVGTERVEDLFRTEPDPQRAWKRGPCL